MQEESSGCRPEVSYPCRWEYKVIGTDEGAVRRAIGRVLGGRVYQLDVSNRSAAGKYTSLRLSLRVEDEDDRNAIFAGLKEHRDVVALL